MANAIELAKAYVQIVPSAQGIQSSLTQVLDKPAAAAGKTAGGSIASGIKSALGTVGKVTATSLAAATSATVVFGKAAISAGKDFDASMSQVAATMGLTVDQIKDLREFAQKMGRTTVFSATEAADALNYMALAGYDAETSMSMLPNVLNLAAAGNFDLARASDMVTDAASALGLSIGETSVLVDQMAKTASKSNTSVEQLGDAILTIGGTAQFMTGGTSELAAVLGLLADNGIKGSEAGTHLRNMLLKLSSPTKDGAAQMKALGLSVYDAKGKMRSMPEIFGDMSKSLSALTDEEQVKALSDIFNTRDIAAAQALLKTTAKRWNELDSAISDAGGAAKQMAATQLDNLAGDTTLFKSALEGAYIAVSDRLTPSLRTVVQFGSKGLSDMTAAFKSGGFAGAVSVFGNMMETAVKKLVSFTPKLVSVGAQLFQSVLNGVLGALPMLSSALPQILKSVMVLFLNVGAGIAQALPQIMTSIVKALPVLIPQFVSGLVSLMVMVLQGWTQIIEPIVAVLPDILTALVTALFENLPLLLAGFVQLTSKIVENLPAILSAIWDAIVLAWDGWIAPALEKVGEFFAGMWEGIQGIFACVGEWFNVNVIQPIAGFFEGLWNGISTAAGAVIEWIETAWNTAKNWLNTNIIEPLAGFFRGLWQGIVNAWNTVIGPWIEIARRLWDKIREGASQAWEGIKSIWSTVSGWFSGNIVSPVKNFFSDMWNGLKTGAANAWTGIKNTWTVVSSWFSTKIITPVKNFFVDMWNNLKTGAKNAWTGIKNVFSPVINWFKDTFRIAWEGVKNVFSTGGRIFTGIKEGIENVFKTVVNAIIRGINTVVAFPFNAINGFLNTLRNISILGVSPFSWIGNISVPQIPQLAMGAVLTRPTLMIGGEDGDEAIVPLSKNTEWIQAVALEMEEATNGGEAELLEEILNKLDNLGIYLDGETLVGGISRRMDGALGNNAGMRQRGVAVG